MKIYWSDRERKPAPFEALFHFVPFFKSQFFKGPWMRVDTLPSPASNLEVKKQSDLPSRDDWIQKVEQALSSTIEKVVLARRQTLELEEAPDPFAIAATLEAKREGAFLFCIQEGNRAFVGASPEKLFSRKGNQLTVEAMAGTRKRGKTLEEDLFLQNELLSSAKDLREILPIQSFLLKRLSPLCELPPAFSPISIYKTHNVQHLYSQGMATLKPFISDEEILQAIHPTPALSGEPQDRALDLIQKLEPFQRGHYGGVIGWKTNAASEWAVAIRSCLIEDKRVHLFSGAGIVQGSTGASEWDENHKAQLFDFLRFNQ